MLIVVMIFSFHTRKKLPVMIYLLYQIQKMLFLIHKLLEDDLKMRGTNQKLKLLYLKEIFEEETDNEHSISMP